jgi:hypothetical protein
MTWGGREGHARAASHVSGGKHARDAGLAEVVDLDRAVFERLAAQLRGEIAALARGRADEDRVAIQR